MRTSQNAAASGSASVMSCWCACGVWVEGGCVWGGRIGPAYLRVQQWVPPGRWITPPAAAESSSGAQPQHPNASAAHLSRHRGAEGVHQELQQRHARAVERRDGSQGAKQNRQPDLSGYRVGRSKRGREVGHRSALMRRRKRNTRSNSTITSINPLQPQAQPHAHVTNQPQRAPLSAC